MRLVPHLQRGTAVIACLALAGGLSACTHAKDWNAASGRPEVTGYDLSGIQPQQNIIDMLPPGALSDGVLDVGASTDYPPAEFLDSSGKAVGYEVDLSGAIAAVLGMEVRTHTAEFDSIIAVVGSKFDVGMSSFTVTREREAAMDMVAMINVGSQFNVPAGNPGRLDPSDHLNLCGLTIGAQVGTAQDDALKEFSQDCTDAGREAIDVRSYSTQSEATTALSGGSIDAMYSDSTVAGYAVTETGGRVETAGEIEDSLPQAIVLPKSDPQLTAAIQAAMQYLMDSGIWQDILATWGIQGAALTTAELNPSVEE